MKLATIHVRTPLNTSSHRFPPVVFVLEETDDKIVDEVASRIAELGKTEKGMESVKEAFKSLKDHGYDSTFRYLINNIETLNKNPALNYTKGEIFGAYAMNCLITMLDLAEIGKGGKAD